MNINEITRAGQIRPTQTVEARPVRTEATPDASLPKDRAEFNRDLQQEARILDGARLVFDALPDVRADKIALAKQRLAEGFYDRPAVQEQIAAKLAGDVEARPTPPISLEQKGEIKRRLTEGFYDRPEVIDSVANGLAEDAEL